ncbi:TraV family lipoprotein [Psychromonas aquimarina]|uniref:TraV family lipoprotein n=1 Tax=Psychromonas aquimarina TaxID=444919 RepID=UPI0003F5C5CF|nr:TraV family lipoprotein [Psychromonas aquimarina]
MKHLFLFLGVLSLTACTVGQSEFNCSGGDNNALCGSSRAIYKAADGDIELDETLTVIHNGEAKQISLSEFQGIGNNSESFKNEDANNSEITSMDSRSGYKVTQTPPSKNTAIIQNTTTKELAHDVAYSDSSQVPHKFSFDGNVIREPTKVMRIWVAPWTDRSDDLHLSSLIFTDIEKRKWAILSVDENNTVSTVIPHLGNSASSGKTKGKGNTNLNGMNIKQVDKQVIEQRFKGMSTK